MKDYKLVDLFAGCGGLSLGMEQAGFTVSFASDIDPICSKTYLYNRPQLTSNRMFIGDIANLNKDIKKYSQALSNIDLVCGGPPCQGFSMANRQRVIDDPRNILYKEYLKFLTVVRPKFFVMENVKGMLNKVGEILEDFSSMLGSEYNVSYVLLNAKYFGVPQSRERLIFIGNRIGVDSSKITKKLQEYKDSPVSYTLYDAIGNLPELKPNRVKNNSSREDNEIGFFERDYNYPSSSFTSFINNNRAVNKLYNHKNRYNNDRDIEIYSRLPQGANSLHESIEDIMPYKSRNHMFKDKYFKLEYNNVSKTITSHMKNDCNMYIHPTQARGLSPREAARIQTFPDDFVFVGPQNSWYKQIGNAVPVKLAEAIGKEIIKYL